MLKLTLLSLLFVTFSVFAENKTISCNGVRITSTTNHDLAQDGLSGGLATFDNSGYRVIKYDIQLETTPEVMNHVIAHECAHHILGHADNHIGNYYAKERLQERPADCMASKILVSQLGYGKKEFKVIESFLIENTSTARAQHVLRCAQ